MKTILICPGYREAVAGLGNGRNLVELPILGKSILERWLEFLASSGRHKVIVLASEYPERIRALVGNGERWGLLAHVFAERLELSRFEARAKYCEPDSQDEVFMMDRLPMRPFEPLLGSYEQFFDGTIRFLETVSGNDRIGMRQIKPGVWVGLRTSISKDVNLVAPSWIGDDVRIEGACSVGPFAVIEDRCLVEQDTTLCDSVVFAENFVGRSLEIKDSLISGSEIINHQTGSLLRATDDFIVSSLLPMPKNAFCISPLSRTFALLVFLFTLPVALIFMIYSKLRKGGILNARVAVRPNLELECQLDRTLIYYELRCKNRLLKRWPQLINVILGEFAWVGNPPLNPTESVWLTTEFDKLWFKVPTGLLSLADAENCEEVFSYEGRAHAAYYAVQKSTSLDFLIFFRSICIHLFGMPPIRDHLEETQFGLGEELIR